MNEFLKNANLVWLVGIVSAAIGGLWAFYRFVYEKKLERFNNAAVNIFSNDEDKVLAAVANLGVFKRDFLFQKITTDVLLTRLYKELNYNITNAIANALVRFSNRRELIVIADRIADINRNFSFQSYPYERVVGNIKRLFSDVNEIKTLPNGKLAQEVLNKRVQQYAEDFLKFQEKLNYETWWHQQITAETYAHIVRGIGTLKISRSALVLGYLKQVLLSWDFRFYGKKIPVKLYQNCFGNILLVRYKTNYCSIIRSDFTSTTIADVDFNNIETIYDCCFNRARFEDCKFNNGRIAQGLIIDSEFNNVSFSNIHFENIFFAGCSFKNCSFHSCTGLTELNFYGAELDTNTRETLTRSIQKKMESLQFLGAYYSVQNSNLNIGDKNSIADAQARKIRTSAEIEQIYTSALERVIKVTILVNASINFKFNEVYYEVMKMPLHDLQKKDLLKLLSHNTPLNDFVVELYDAGLDDSQIGILISIKPEVDFDAYSNAIHQSLLAPAEKKALIQQLQNLFNSADEVSKKTKRQLKLKVGEEMNEIDKGQLEQ